MSIERFKELMNNALYELDEIDTELEDLKDTKDDVESINELLERFNLFSMNKRLEELEEIVPADLSETIKTILEAINKYDQILDIIKGGLGVEVKDEQIENLTESLTLTYDDKHKLELEVFKLEGALKEAEEKRRQLEDEITDLKSELGNASYAANTAGWGLTP